MTDNLQPCPHCHGAPTLEKTRHGRPVMHWVKCSCGASGGSYNKLADAIAAWNRRPSVQEAAPSVPPLGKVLALASCVEEKVNAEGGEATVSRIVALTVAAINEAAAREAAPAAAPADLTETAKAPRRAMDEIDELSNRLVKFAYPQGMAMLGRADQLPCYEMAVAARAVAPAGVPPASETISAAEAAARQGRLAEWWNAATRDQRLAVIDGARHLLSVLGGAPAGMPEGWKLVPVEPTPEMVKAATRWFSDKTTALGVYRDALSAAPASPTPTAQPTNADVECYWKAEDREIGHAEISDIMEDCDHGVIMEIEHVAIVKRTFHATLPADGDSDDGWEVVAPTEAEAQAALDAELARRSSAPSAGEE